MTAEKRRAELLQAIEALAAHDGDGGDGQHFRFAVRIRRRVLPRASRHGLHKELTREYFQTLNEYWLDELHVDGFRYDYVPGMWESPVGPGYTFLTHATYPDSKGIARFADPAGYSRIIQCAEHLPDPRGVLRTTYSNTAWSNELMDKTADTAI